MRPFWKKIINKNYKINENIHFAIYGLGDRSYGESFNMAGRKLKQRLLML